MKYQSFKEIPAKVLDYLRRLSQTPATPQTFEHDLDKMLQCLKEHSTRACPDKKAAFESVFRKPEKGPSTAPWHQFRASLIKAYNTAYSRQLSVTNFENAEHRNERRAQWRLMFFRWATTAGIALVIMGAYALAQSLGIQMPLMRIPVVAQ